MKGLIKTIWPGLGLVVPISMIALLGSPSANAANYLIVNETFDPPTLATPGGWEYGDVMELSREYVDEGVGGSMALQISAKLVGDYASVSSAMFQSGVMGGNEWATRENTVLSFDIKIDQPGMLSVQAFLDGYPKYLWNYPDGGPAQMDSVARILLGSYQPGIFQKIVVPLNDPRWSSEDLPVFDPSGRTYNNVTLVVDTEGWPNPGPFKVTVDNVQITTKNAMVPFVGTSAGEVTPVAEGYRVIDRGVAEHIGSYEAACTIPFDFSPCSIELTAANGDKLFGTFFTGGNDYGFQIEKGTGRFNGVVGSYRAALTWDPTFTSYTATLRGGLSTVGWNKK